VKQKRRKSRPMDLRKRKQVKILMLSLKKELSSNQRPRLKERQKM